MTSLAHHNNHTNSRWIHSSDALIHRKVTYTVKFIGYSEVPGSKGMELVKLALQRLKFSRHIKRTEGTKPPKVDLSININSVTIQDAKNKLTLHRIKLHRISFCADDKKDRRLFSFITKHDDGKHYCYGFDSPRLANEITLTIGQAFELAYEKYLKTSPLSPEVTRKKVAQKSSVDEMNARIKELEEENKNLRERIRKLELEKTSADTSTEQDAAEQQNLYRIQSRPLPNPTKLFTKTLRKKMGNTKSKPAENPPKNGARFATAQPDYDVFKKQSEETHPYKPLDNISKKSQSGDESNSELYTNLEDIISTLKTMMDGETKEGGNSRNYSSGSEDVGKVPSNTPNESLPAQNIEELLKQHKLLMNAMLAQKSLQGPNTSNSNSSLDSSVNAASTESYILDSADSLHSHVKEDYDSVTQALKQLCGEEGYMKLTRSHGDGAQGNYVDNMYESVASLMQAVRTASNPSHDVSKVIAKHPSVTMNTKSDLRSNTQRQTESKRRRQNPTIPGPLVFSNPPHSSNVPNSACRSSTSSLTTDSGSYSFSPLQTKRRESQPLDDAMAQLWMGNRPMQNIWSYENSPAPFFHAYNQFPAQSQADPFNMQPFAPPIPPRAGQMPSNQMPPGSPKMAPNMRKTKDLFDVTSSPATTRKNYVDARATSSFPLPPSSSNFSPPATSKPSVRFANKNSKGNYHVLSHPLLRKKISRPRSKRTHRTRKQNQSLPDNNDGWV